MLDSMKRSARVAAAALAFGAFLAAPLSAATFPALNLTSGPPFFEFGSVSTGYSGNSTTGTLSSDGNLIFTSLPAGADPLFGEILISAIVNEDAQTASGSLSIYGMIPNLGFTSLTLLTGTFSSTAGNPTFGVGGLPTNPNIQILFTVTGGDAASLFGPRAAVVFGDCCGFESFPGSFDSSFTINPFGSTARFFAVVPVPLPAGLPLFLAALGGLGIAARRRKAA